MTIRTISQLPEATAAQDTDLLEISESFGQKYQSRKLKLGTLESKFASDISASVGSSFKLYDAGNIPLDVNGMSQTLAQVKSGTTTFGGIKTFASVPRIPSALAYTTDPSQVVNVKRTKELIDERSLFIGPEYMVDADPGSDNTPSTTRQRDEYMYWRIDDLGRDSTEWKNPEYGNRKTESDGVECQHTGYLTIYGWLADNGNVRAADAWVGLFAKVQVRDSESLSDSLTSKWVLLQLQPWVIGQKSGERQYVGFNVPVKAGLRLKIKTGFTVNGHSDGSSGQNSIGLALNQPNMFVGYTIRVQD